MESRYSLKHPETLSPSLSRANFGSDSNCKCPFSLPQYHLVPTQSQSARPSPNCWLMHGKIWRCLQNGQFRQLYIYIHHINYICMGKSWSITCMVPNLKICSKPGDFNGYAVLMRSRFSWSPCGGSGFWTGSICISAWQVLNIFVRQFLMSFRLKPPELNSWYFLSILRSKF